MTWYIVITRDRHRTPISRHVTLADAGNKITRERGYDRWTVVAQDSPRASAPARPLTQQERLKLEQALFPSLYE